MFPDKHHFYVSCRTAKAVIVKINIVFGKTTIEDEIDIKYKKFRNFKQDKDDEKDHLKEEYHQILRKRKMIKFKTFGWNDFIKRNTHTH